MSLAFMPLLHEQVSFPFPKEILILWYCRRYYVLDPVGSSKFDFRIVLDRFLVHFIHFELSTPLVYHRTDLYTKTEMALAPAVGRERRTALKRYDLGFISIPLPTLLKQKPYSIHRCTRKRTFGILCASLSLPAWEREYERERGLAGTSYESATVEEVKSVGDGFLRLLVDTAVTCTVQQYQSEGQFLFIKPWGDEDGCIQACCFNALPGHDPMMHFFVPEESAVGVAALAGEMLEVSEVMGDGFQKQLLGSDFLDKPGVVAVCGEQFSVPVLLALRQEARPSVIFFVANAHGPFASLAQDWVDGNPEKRQARFCADNEQLKLALQLYLTQQLNIALLLSGDSDLCEAVGSVISSRLEEGQFSVFTP